MLRKIFRPELFQILVKYLPPSILGIICIPFDLIFAKVISIIFGNKFLIQENIFDLYILGSYVINQKNIIIFILVFGITPVLIRAYLSYYTLNISKNIAVDLFQNLYKYLVHSDGKYISIIGDKNALGIITNHLSTFINLFITPIAQAFSSITIAFLFIIVSIVIEPKASLLILITTFILLLLLIKFTKRIREVVTKDLGIYRSTQIGFVSSALEQNDLLKYANEKNYMTNRTFEIDSRLRLAIKNSLFLSQSARFFIEASLPISFIFIAFEFINTGKTNNLLIALILILKSIPFIQQFITCISTAQLNQKSYFVLRNLLKEINISKIQFKSGLNLKQFSEILINEIHISEHGITFPKNVIQLKKLNLIMGKSGAGKSTYLKALTGYFDLQQNTFFLKDNKNKLTKKKNFIELYSLSLYQSQNYKLLPLTVLENIKLLNKEVSIRRVKEMMKLFDIFETSKLSNRQLLNLDLEKRPDFLSGGEIQRLCLVRDFLSKYEIIFLDEPTSALDSLTTKKIIKSINQLTALKTIVISTHEKQFTTISPNIYQIKSKR